MKTQTLWIDGPIPSLNDLIAAAKVRGHTNRRGRVWNKYNTMKRDWNERVFRACRDEGIESVTSRADFVFVWHASSRVDKDNISGAGRKLILDGLVNAGIIRDDDWAHVGDFTDRFVKDAKHPGVLVEIHSED